jgi:hypothetical protein
MILGYRQYDPFYVYSRTLAQIVKQDIDQDIENKDECIKDQAPRWGRRRNEGESSWQNRDII